jgi:uncharacterized protein (DUF4415 family)
MRSARERPVPDVAARHPGYRLTDVRTLRNDQMARRPNDPRHAAEAAFKVATTKPPEPAPAPKTPSLPGAKEMVSLRIDRDVLDYFQEEGPGWQERINAALRKAAGK